jgi:starch phosphorylase
VRGATTTTAHKPSQTTDHPQNHHTHTNNTQVGNDWFLVANDFADYLRAQAEVDALYQDQDEWTRRSILYTAGSGKFSSDRTIVEYAKDIWRVEPCRPPAAQ